MALPSTCFLYLSFAILLTVSSSTRASVIPSLSESSSAIDGILAAASASGSPENRFISYLPLKDQRVMTHLKQKPKGSNGGDVEQHEDGLGSVQVKDILELLLARLGVPELPEHTESPEVNRHIAEVCGQSATLQCGRMALKETGMGHKDLGAKCDARKAFLYCIEDARADCKSKILKEQRYPILPPLDQIAAFQRLVKHSLWTGGGCILAY